MRIPAAPARIGDRAVAEALDFRVLRSAPKQMTRETHPAVPGGGNPLVPRHSGFDRLGVTENGQVSGGDEHLDAAPDAWLAADVAEALQRADHLVPGRRAELEMALHVGLGRGTAVDAGIGVDEGQVLPLPLGEAFRGHRHTIDSSAPLATERQDEHTLSGRAERSRAL